jgi:hypothetical protein
VEDASGIFSPFPFRPQNPKFLWQLVVENAGDKTVYIFTVPDLDGMVHCCRGIDLRRRGVGLLGLRVAGVFQSVRGLSTWEICFLGRT